MPPKPSSPQDREQRRGAADLSNGARIAVDVLLDPRDELPLHLRMPRTIGVGDAMVHHDFFQQAAVGDVRIGGPVAIDDCATARGRRKPWM